MFRDVMFEWDEAKAASNLLEHGIAFQVACEVFFDPLARIADASEPEESRDALIGRTVDQSVLFVVHVIRHEETIRLISARKATRQERRRFEQF